MSRIVQPSKSSVVGGARGVGCIPGGTLWVCPSLPLTIGCRKTVSRWTGCPTMSRGPRPLQNELSVTVPVFGEAPGPAVPWCDGPACPQGPASRKWWPPTDDAHAPGDSPRTGLLKRPDAGSGRRPIIASHIVGQACIGSERIRSQYWLGGKGKLLRKVLPKGCSHPKEESRGHSSPHFQTEFRAPEKRRNSRRGNQTAAPTTRHMARAASIGRRPSGSPASASPGRARRKRSGGGTRTSAGRLSSRRSGRVTGERSDPQVENPSLVWEGRLPGGANSSPTRGRAPASPGTNSPSGWAFE